MATVDERGDSALKRGWRIQFINGISWAGDRDGDPAQTFADTKEELVDLIEERDRREGRLSD